MSRPVPSFLNALSQSRQAIRQVRHTLDTGPIQREATATAMWAVSQADPKPLRAMLDQGMPLDIRLGDMAWTPLHAAAGLGHADTVRLLLERGAEVNLEDGVGESALGYAAERGSLPVVPSLWLSSFWRRGPIPTAAPIRVLTP